MTPYFSDAWLDIYQGDVRDVLPSLPADSVDCIVTSPPYWGLRDYGGDGQLGLERTPEEYVANMVGVFRELRRVLKPSGTCWLNLGDSYNAGTTAKAQDSPNNDVGYWQKDRRSQRIDWPGLKPKDLCGIPWRVAFALQQPYYTGSIKDEKDRVWLAAMLDAEGCLFIHKRKAGQPNGQGYHRTNDSYGAGMEIANTSEAIVKRCQEIAGGHGSIFLHNKDRRQPLYRWSMRSNECRDVVRELYPYLVAKQHQARLLLACPSSGPDAEKAHASLILLHNGKKPTIDFKAPEPMYEPGWYVRSDVIWSKSNPMPESVTDRPTKSHEYLFLLTKSARYYFDADAVRETAKYGFSEIRGVTASDHWDASSGANGANPTRQKRTVIPGKGGYRNLRSVWTIATKPYPDAHFAVFPPELPERCIKAGSPEMGTVLDPFAGSGTTGVVANRLSRRAILVDLNGDYLKQQLKRNAQTPLGLGA